MGTLLDFVGWSGLDDAEKLAATCGGAIGLSVATMLRALFGGLNCRRPKKKAKKRKGRR